MKLRVERFDPFVDEKAYQVEYDIPFTSEDRYTVMDGLKYVFDHIDSSLAFYSHSVCNHGICGRCLMTVDGKPALACTKVLEANVVEIKPKKGQVVKDLVVK